MRKASEEVVELMVVRHGETTWNAAAIMQGQASSSLNDVGKEQAHAMADCLASEQAPIAAIYSSDLERALDTASIIASKCHVSQVFLMEELRERHLGKLQGLSRKDARNLEPEAYKIFISHCTNEPIPGGGESLDELYSRSKVALESIAEKHFEILPEAQLLMILLPYCTRVSCVGMLLPILIKNEPRQKFERAGVLSSGCGGVLSYWHVMTYYSVFRGLF